MERAQFGRLCPVCGGPLVRGEGLEGCVICGHAVQSSPRRRSFAGRTRDDRPRRRPRQLMLPMSSLPRTAWELAPSKPSQVIASTEPSSRLREKSGVCNAGGHQSDHGAHSPPPLVTARKVDARPDEAAEQHRTNDDAREQHRFRAA